MRQPSHARAARGVVPGSADRRESDDRPHRLSAGIRAHARESLNPAYGNVSETIQRAAQAVRLHPRHHARSIDVLCGTQVSGWFDQRKLERALYNLLLNACEAAPTTGGVVEVTAGGSPEPSPSR